MSRIPARWQGLPLRLELVSLSAGRTKGFTRFLADKKIPDNGGPYWQLLRAISWGNIEVPEGWLTDLTSIPWWIPWIRREGRHTPGSVLHDRLYAKPPPGWRRRDCDRAYRWAMADNGTAAATRRMIWSGVRVGGWRAWNRYRRVQAR